MVATDGRRHIAAGTGPDGGATGWGSFESTTFASGAKLMASRLWRQWLTMSCRIKGLMTRGFGILETIRRCASAAMIAKRPLKMVVSGADGVGGVNLYVPWSQDRVPFRFSERTNRGGGGYDQG